MKTVVLSGRQTVEAMEAVFADAGFECIEREVLGPGPAPDRILWRRAEGSARLFRDLGTGNLVVVFEGEVRVPGGLIPMPPQEAAALLRASDPQSRLAGLQAAEILSDASLLSLVVQRVGDTDPLVADRAAEVLSVMAGDSPAIDPGAALFSVPGWRREKLQVLRWLMAEPPRKPAVVAGAVARALDDPDWEIAVTAMLVAGRFKLRDLAARIARLPLPTGRSQGVTGDEPRLLLALRDACLERLGHPVGKALPAGVAAAAAGDLSGLSPHLAIFVAALVQPLPAETTPPPPAPAIEIGSEGPALSDGRLLVWIPPGRYWLGEAYLRGEESNPVRRVELETGFYIDAEPRGPASLAAARAEADRLATRLGRPVVLADPQRWEMAARGPDGRRFPWGANRARGVRVDLSPLGLAGIASGPGEWLEASTSAGHRGLVAGGKRSPLPAARHRTASDVPHNYRFIYSLQ